MARTQTPSPADTERVDIAFGLDGAFVPHAAAVIRSIVTSAPAAPLRFIMLTEGLSHADRTSLQSLAPTARFHWREVQKADFPAFTNREHFTAAILYRLGLEHLAPADCHRVIYLDSDIVVRRDIRDLWAADLEQHPIGAVADCDTDAGAFAARWSLPDTSASYFNSGVLLIDLDRVRKEQLFSKAAQFIAEHGADLRFADQDALNHVLWSRWHAIEPCWNVQRLDAIKASHNGQRAGWDLFASAAVIHFTGADKPWLPGAYHPWAWSYWAHLLRTPYALRVKRSFGMSTLELARICARWARCRLSPPPDIGRRIGNTFSQAMALMSTQATHTRNRPIAFISTMEGDPWGGSEELWGKAALRLRQEGFGVRACVQAWSPPHKKVVALMDAGVEVYQRPRDYSPVQKAIRIALRRKPKVIIHDLQRWLRQTPPSLVVINHTMMMPPYDLMEMLAANGWPFISVSHVNAEFHWPTDEEAVRYRRVMNTALKCYFVSNGNMALAKKQIGFDPANVGILRNPVGVDRDAPWSWPGIDATDTLQMACVGRLDPRSKGQDLLFDVLSAPRWRERSWHLNLYGSGPIKEGLQRMAAQAGLGADRVSFKGFHDVADIWANNHVLVQPSRAEGLPITIVEALLCGRPVMTTDVGGSAELVEDNATGFVADAPTVKQIDEALERLWSRRGELRQMGQTAAAAVRRQIGPDPTGDFVAILKGYLEEQAAIRAADVVGSAAQDVLA